MSLCDAAAFWVECRHWHLTAMAGVMQDDSERLVESCSAQASVLEIWRHDLGSPEVQKRARGMAEALAAANGAASAGLYAAGSHPSILSGGGSLRETFRGWRAA